MPIDPHPAEAGNVVLDADERALREIGRARLAGEGPPPAWTEGPPGIRVLRKAEEVDPDLPRYVSHFASCPAAASHRRR